jgi:hypothetical protein
MSCLYWILRNESRTKTAIANPTSCCYLSYAFRGPETLRTESDKAPKFRKFIMGWNVSECENSQRNGPKMGQTTTRARRGWSLLRLRLDRPVEGEADIPEISQNKGQGMDTPRTRARGPCPTAPPPSPLTAGPWHDRVEGAAGGPAVWLGVLSASGTGLVCWARRRALRNPPFR